jgi:hypothetical protein
MLACSPGVEPAAPEYAAEHRYLLAVAAAAACKPKYTLPEEYTREIMPVLLRLSFYLEVTFNQVVYNAEVDTDRCSSLLQMTAIMRDCISKKLLHAWSEYTRMVVARVPARIFGVVPPWDDGGADFTAITNQAAVIKTAAELVGTSLLHAWHVFVTTLENTEDCALGWMTPEQVCAGLRGTSKYFMYGESPGKCLLYFFLRSMKTEEHQDDNVLAVIAARELNTALTRTYPKPVKDHLDLDPHPLALDALLDRLNETFACSHASMLTLLINHGLVDQNASAHSVIGATNRILQNLHVLPLRMHTGPSLELRVSMRIRAYVRQAFSLAHDSRRGVRVADMLRLHSKERVDQPRTLGAKLGCLENSILRALRILFIKYEEYTSSWAKILATYTAKRAMGCQVGAPGAAIHFPFLYSLATAMAPAPTPGTPPEFITLQPLIAHLNACKTRPSATRPVWMTCPSPVGARDAAAIAARYLEPTPAKWVENMCTSVELAVMLDGMPVQDYLLEEGGLALTRAASHAPRVRDLHLETAWGTPTPRQLAGRLNYSLGETPAMPCETEVLACALVWNVGALVRHETVLPALSHPATLLESSGASSPKKRKRARVEAVQCMVCCGCFAAEPTRSCDHYLCVGCAVAALETRVVDVITKDGSTEEQTRGNIAKCPHPTCHRSLLWAAPYMGPECRYYLDKIMLHKQVQTEARVEKKTACAGCWDYVSADPAAGVCGTCATCEHATCTVCGRLAHYGEVCSAATRGTSLSPEIILNEAKTQPCPRCGSRTTKDGGCNHISCTQCPSHWCWICSAELVPGEVTTHYQTSTVCSLHEYSEDTETERIRSVILGRADLSEETKQSVLQLLLTTFVQNAHDL